MDASIRFLLASLRCALLEFALDAIWPACRGVFERYDRNAAKPNRSGVLHDIGKSLRRSAGAAKFASFQRIVPTHRSIAPSHDACHRNGISRLSLVRIPKR